MSEKDFDRRKYLDFCARSKVISSAELAVIGVVIVLVLSFLDLFLTMFRIYTGPFQDSNPIAQMIIEWGLPEGLVVLKVGACLFFGYVCLKYRELLVTQIGVGFACLAHLLLMFYWAIVF